VSYALTVGSDCLTGKRQYTKAAAQRTAATLRTARRARSINAYYCGWCQCWHIGNKGGDTSKGRQHR